MSDVTSVIGKILKTISSGLCMGAFAALMFLIIFYPIIAYQRAHPPLTDEEIESYLSEGYVKGDKHDTLIKYEYETVCELEDLLNSDETSGTFFLGTGSIRSEMVYQFYYKTADGGFELGAIPASNDKTTIYYISDGETPRIEKLTGHYPTIDIDDGKKGTAGYTLNDNVRTYHVYVPEGSITNTFIDQTVEK